MPEYSKNNTGSFVNPYHFIPLEESIAPVVDFNGFMNAEYTFTEEQSLNSGWLECELETCSPVFVPNTTFQDRFEYRGGPRDVVKSYDFFSHADLSVPDNRGRLHRPVIPGSSIRGVIRSAFEILTNSCMSTVDHEHYLHKRYSKPYANAGRIEIRHGGYWIQPCDTAGSEPATGTFYRFEGEIGIRGTRSLKYFTPKGEPFALNTGDVERFKKLLETYRDDRINQKLGNNPGDHHGYTDIDANNPDGALVFYETKEDRLYISPAQIGKEVFHNKLSNLVGNYKPCDSLDELCPACVLFGIAGRKEALASRVRFSDAKTANANADDSVFYHPPGILPELAAPKPSATEFYLQKTSPNHELWTYDYAGWWARDDRGLKEFKYDLNYSPTIMGRKMYWHNLIDEPPYMDHTAATKRNVGIRPVKKNVVFRFRVHFNRIYDFELLQLAWALTNGMSCDHGHKLGMGKPVGLGSIRITIPRAIVRKLNLNQDSFYELADRTEWLRTSLDDSVLECSGKTLSAFRRMTALRPNVGEIRYPVNENERAPNPLAAFHWFKANKGSSIATPVIGQHLKLISAERDVKLKKYRPDSSATPKKQGFRRQR